MLARMHVRSFVIALGCLLVCSAGRVFAQHVLDPQVVEFDPSPDHWAVSAAGQPIVSRYDLAVYQVGASNPYNVVSLGKPVPQSNGKIEVSLLSALSKPLQPSVIYESQVTVVGPSGSSLSNWSNTFAVGGPCTYAVAASNLAFAGSGGSGTINVTTGSGCVWSAGSGAAWVTIGAGGTGSGTVTFTIAANTSASSRSAIINVATQSLKVTQAAASTACTFTLSSSTTAFPTAGGTGLFSVTAPVTAPGGCAWMPERTASWLTISTGGGTGNGSNSFSVAANPSPLPRTALIRVSNQSIIITQAGVQGVKQYGRPKR